MPKPTLFLPTCSVSDAVLGTLRRLLHSSVRRRGLGRRREDRSRQLQTPRRPQRKRRSEDRWAGPRGRLPGGAEDAASPPPPPSPPGFLGASRAPLSAHRHPPGLPQTPSPLRVPAAAQHGPRRPSLLGTPPTGFPGQSHCRNAILTPQHWGLSERREQWKLSQCQEKGSGNPGEGARSGRGGREGPAREEKPRGDRGREERQRTAGVRGRGWVA